jgi:hypothetical protein
MKKRVVIIGFYLLLISCGKKEQSEAIQSDIEKETVQSDYNVQNEIRDIWKITNVENYPNFNKSIVYIELKTKVSETELKDIGEVVRSMYSASNLYVFYSVKDGAETWAYTHFRPSLELRIIGATIEQDDKIEHSEEVKGDVLGKWKSHNSLMGSVLIYHQIGKEKYMTIKFFDGGESVKKVKISKKNGKTKLNDDNGFGEYYILEDNGNLGMYGDNGKFDEAVIIN